MLPLTATFSLLVAAAGWYYMFYSRAASRLGEIESPRLNRIRDRLRRVNGGVMFTMAILFFAGFNAVDPYQNPNAFVAIWSAVFFMLLGIVMLVLVDVRLTWRMRHPGRKDE